MKPKFEEELKKTKNIKILNFLNRIEDLNQDEINQLKLITLWESIESFNNKRGCIFSTHLYNSCRFKFLKHINKNKEKKVVLEYIEQSCEDKPNKEEFEIIDELPILYRSILKDRFYYKINLVNLSKMYNMKRSQIKILIEDAKRELKKCIE